MKGNIKITELDYERLNSLISRAKTDSSIEFKNLDVLASEIKRATKVDSKKIEPEFVTMNSVVKVVTVGTNKPMTVKVVYPKDADFKKRHVSIFSPLGSALLGYKVGDTVSFEAPKGEIDIKIESIDYQPESSGDFSL
ncbi:GreA/GreB family elongation factor [Saccharicrinis carchari]|uniref:GreA/GreB family elongation factor n=1 Tax=Saccharicrinis carchari TaxID=1168039 RepID=A0A521AJS7_SACCC|nr:GreA/GreB family elongation factor [Saccharicrinis carchari]SMO35052.1 GreA/GreB family elongation factor [Saccharicrinis carchari]